MSLLNYLKYIGIFIINVFIITFLTSLLSLTNINTLLITKLSIIITALSFFIIASIASNKSTQKGVMCGLKLGIIYVVLLVLINLILFRSKINIDRFIYYIILIASSILGGSFGKNIKVKK